MFYNRPMTREELVLESRRAFERPGFHPTTPTNYAPLRTTNPFETTHTHWTWQNQRATPPADILELDEQFIIEVALPGVVLDDIELKIEANVLTVCAKRTPTLFEERATILQKELPLVYLVRHFEFDNRIMSEQIEARLDRGMLYVSIPKVEAARRIPVSVGVAEQLTTISSSVKTRVSEQKVPVKG